MLRIRIFGLPVLAVAVSLGGNIGCPSATPDSGNENGNDNSDSPPDQCTPGIVECNTDSQCDDGDPCTTDTCDDGCCENTPECRTARQCDDGDLCTTDVCDDGCCENSLVDCDDELFCTGTESCDSDIGECISTGDPCVPGEVCHEPDDECIPEPPEAFSVSVTGCPTQLGQGDGAGLAAVAANARGAVTYLWELLSGSGTLDNSSARTPTFTATDSTDVIIQVTATDEGGSDEADDPPGGVIRTATDTCTIDVISDNSVAKRLLPACFHRSVSAVITIDLSVPGEAIVVGLQENPPSGWAVSNISDGGEWDATGKAVKWFFVDESLSRSVSYTITPSADGEDVVCFSGRVNVNGSSDHATGGHRCVGSCSGR